MSTLTLRAVFLSNQSDQSLSGPICAIYLKVFPERARFSRWAIVLAGGDGKRLLPLTRTIAGDDRPKQFCNVVGGSTLLQQTLNRISGLVPCGRTLIVLTEIHNRYYAEQLPRLYPTRCLIQPENKGTTPAILYALMQIKKQDPEGLVAIFPSDHHFASRHAFSRRIGTCFSLAECHPYLAILLGIQADKPETSYGWIEPGADIPNSFTDSVAYVRRFWEKPSETQARDLMMRRCLWNSFVMIGQVESFLHLIRQSVPELHSLFEGFSHPFFFPSSDNLILREIYRSIPSSSFSDDVLTVCSEGIAVMRTSLRWSDLGEPQRVLSLSQKKPVKGDYSPHNLFWDTQNVRA